MEAIAATRTAPLAIRTAAGRLRRKAGFQSGAWLIALRCSICRWPRVVKKLSRARRRGQLPLHRDTCHLPSPNEGAPDGPVAVNGRTYTSASNAAEDHPTPVDAVHSDQKSPPAPPSFLHE